MYRDHDQASNQDRGNTDKKQEGLKKYLLRCLGLDFKKAGRLDCFLNLVLHR
jgi:hypothetical protein